MSFGNEEFSRELAARRKADEERLRKMDRQSNIHAVIIGSLIGAIIGLPAWIELFR